MNTSFTFNIQTQYSSASDLAISNMETLAALLKLQHYRILENEYNLKIEGRSLEDKKANLLDNTWLNESSNNLYPFLSINNLYPFLIEASLANKTHNFIKKITLDSSTLNILNNIFCEEKLNVECVNLLDLELRNIDKYKLVYYQREENILEMSFLTNYIKLMIDKVTKEKSFITEFTFFYLTIDLDLGYLILHIPHITNLIEFCGYTYDRSKKYNLLASTLLNDILRQFNTTDYKLNNMHFEAPNWLSEVFDNIVSCYFEHRNDLITSKMNKIDLDVISSMLKKLDPKFSETHAITRITSDILAAIENELIIQYKHSPNPNPDFIIAKHKANNGLTRFTTEGSDANLNFASTRKILLSVSKYSEHTGLDLQTSYLGTEYNYKVEYNNYFVIIEALTTKFNYRGAIYDVLSKFEKYKSVKETRNIRPSSASSK